jgi:hypothetical protein
MPGNWNALLNQPTFDASTMLLLTDGNVMCNDEGGSASGTSNWWKLIPDPFGSYINGSWSRLSNSPNSPLFFASAVMKDGRVFVAGGEYNGTGQRVELLAAEIFDPLSNNWTVIPTPPGWTNIGDAPCCVIPDGRILLGSIMTNETAMYDPLTNSWKATARKLNSSSEEESWTLLPDQTILTEDCLGHPKTEKYVISSNSWVPTGSTPSDLVDASLEIGPSILLPDGRTIVIGATGVTAIYEMPPISSQPGTWINGPRFPITNGQNLGAKDAPACLLPNGRVLCVAGPVDRTNEFLPPTYFFEFDPVSLTINPVVNPSNNGKEVFQGRMLLLPTGQILFSNGSNNIEVYTPDGSYDPIWRSRITKCPSQINPGITYTLFGTQLNGLSQAVNYGDDASMATNYPIIRIHNTSTNKQIYCRTHDHSTMGVHTGSVIHSTRFTVPSSIEAGKSQLFVIANGIPSEPFQVIVS